ncbi:HEAT repeat domain-containing protein [Billgrantia kenyensis]|uniref:HEAT repeat domain-containing protein n=1 Tax=Billgrantia kenyensis TaxID=321266 RepID=A0A7V9VYE5_9GAMM|nr:HEAT repeat domain-containing protein [Halomonas kenyensis]MBA2777680.1 HEAT repeat domain-containing protein [Halomonas kenyensis]MCG6660350.1 HEAT repeat domain-containing protein [Halomonas kenyensis]
MPSELVGLQRLLYQALQVLTTPPEDPVLRFAVYSAIVLAGLTLLILIQVLVLTELASRRERRRLAFTGHWRPQLAAWSVEHGDALPWPPRGRQEEIWFMLLWLRLRRQVRGQSQQRLNALFEGIGMSGRVVRLLRGRGVHRRLLSLSCLQYLANDRYWADVLPLVNDANPVVALTAAQTLVAMNPERAMQRLIPLVELRRDWATPRLEALCRQAGPTAVSGPLLSRLGEGEEPPARLVALLAWAEPNRVAPWARRFLAGSVEEQEGADVSLCAALSCLGQQRDPRDRPLLLSWLIADSPQVRLVAVQALRRQAVLEDAPFLLERLTDSSWWVRQAAADALVELPGIGDADITTWQHELKDRYGRDALTRAIAERRR